MSFASDFILIKWYSKLVSQSKNDSNSKDKTFSEKKIEDKEDWLNEHGQPSFRFLQSLADNNNAEKLKSIAADLDVNYNPGSSAEELVGEILSATRSDPNTTT